MNQLINIFRKYDFDYSGISFGSNLNDIVNTIENILIRSDLAVEYCRRLIVEIWQHQRSIELNKNIETLKPILDDIVKLEYYNIDSGFIKYSNFIEIDAIKINSSFHLLTNHQIKKLRNIGFGITGFKFEISKTISNIVCTGKHPNLNDKSGLFCIDNNLIDIELTVSNVLMIPCMLKQINMDSVFLDPRERDKIMEICNET